VIPDPWLVANLHDVPLRYLDIAFIKFIAMAARPEDRLELVRQLGLEEFWPSRILASVGA
jgi:hypothetical protein